MKNETYYVKLCTVWTAFAESDFESDAVQRETIGVFQQMPKYWESASGGTRIQALAFVAQFKADAKHHNNDPVHDCWVTQRWAVPNKGVTWPDPGPGFETAPETLNYSERRTAAKAILENRKLP